MFNGNGQLMTETEYINLNTLSKRLGVSKRTVRYWIHDPAIMLPSYKIQKLLLFNWDEVAIWIKQFRVKTANTKALVEKITTDLKKKERSTNGY